MGILWNYTGAVTSESATVVAKVAYDYGTPVLAPKVYTITYDGTTVKTYINGLLVETNTKALAGITQMPVLYIGADYDDTCWFKGILPEFIIYDNALNDVDRVAMEEHLADKWLPTGSTLETGYISKDSSVRPTQTSGQAFLEFNELGLTKSENRITGWNDNTELGTKRPLTIKSGTTLGTRTIKGKDAVYFDNRTFATLPIMTGAENNPDFITIMFVAQFDNFDSSSYPDGDASETILSSTNNSIFRIKKFDGEGSLSTKLADWDGRVYWGSIPKDLILKVDRPLLDLGEVQLHIGTSPEILTPYASPIEVNNHSMLGIAKIPVSGLIDGTQYYGKLSLDGVLDNSTSFKFRTLPKTKKSFKVIVGSCNQTGSTSVVWDKIIAEDPDLFIHTGDFNYLDLGVQGHQEFAKGLDQSISPNILRLLRSTAFEYRYDNHDSLGPTLDKNSAGWDNFLDFFKIAHAYQPTSPLNLNIGGLYNTFQLGRVKCINIETRRNRDPQRDPTSPSKSMLGTLQKQWLKDQLLEAKNNPNTEAIMLLSNVLWTSDRNDPNGDSYLAWNAGWASYETERAEIANFIYENEIKNIFIVCGDVHMQAIDDGRNSCYITDVDGNRVDPNSIDKAYWTPVLEASPFDRYLDIEGGPFNIGDLEGSGGPIGSFEQSYGTVEVLDVGENWIQVKLYTTAYNMNSEWVVNRYHTFNLNTESGEPGTPPPFDYTVPQDINMNGYISKDNTWKKIKQRFVRKDSIWKTQVLKLKFIEGLWKKVYDHNIPSNIEPLTLSHLSGWGADTETFIEVHGKGFRDVTYPNNYGGYYELSSNTGDLFGNFPYGTTIGSVNFTTVDAIKSVTIPPGDNYIALPSAEGSGLTFNIFYNKDLFLGVWVHISPDEMNSETVVNNSIISDTTNTYGIFTELGNGAALIKFNLGPEAVTSAPLRLGWNKVGLNLKNGSDNYTMLYVNETTSSIGLFSVKNFGDPLITPVPILIGKQGSSTITNFHYVPRYNHTSQVLRYFLKPPSEIYLRPIASGEEILIPSQWITGGTNEKLSFTIPTSTPPGNYNVIVKNLNYESNPLPLKVVNPTARTTPFSTKFEDPNDLKDNFYTLHKAWGGANGGVVKENVVQLPGKLKLYGNGDLYTGNIQGVNRDGDLKFHTHENDPKLGQPWTNRVGGCVVYKEKTGFGSYRVKCKIPTELGMCSAFWTFFYNEIYPGDPRWDQFIADGLHPQGNEVDGYYMTRNHEIDIEFPSHLDGGITAEPSFNNMKCNTWRGELQNWDVPPTDPTYWEEYRDNLTPTGEDIYSGVEREYRFDWYQDRVEFFIDGKLKKINTGPTIPDIAGHFTFGVWFPSSPLVSKPWLANPDRAWAGGTVDTDGGRKAMFDRVSMDVSEFSFTPFDQTGLKLRGETYPFGGYRLND